MIFFQRSSCQLFQHYGCLWKIPSVTDTSLFFHQFVTVFVCKIQGKGIVTVYIPVRSRKLYKRVTVHSSDFFSFGIRKRFFAHINFHRINFRNLDKDFHHAGTDQKFPGAGHLTVGLVKFQTQNSILYRIGRNFYAFRKQ